MPGRGLSDRTIPVDVRRRPVVRFGVVFLPVLVLVAIVATVAIFATTHSPPRSPGAPAYSAPFQFSTHPANYVGRWIWYNFSVQANQPNVTWAMLVLYVTPGPLTKAPSNWSLTAVGLSSEVVATFELAAGNWTSSSTMVVVTGETISLETDSSLTLGGFTAAWPTLGHGTEGEELL